MVCQLVRKKVACYFEGEFKDKGLKIKDKIYNFLSFILLLLSFGNASIKTRYRVIRPDQGGGGGRRRREGGY